MPQPLPSPTLKAIREGVSKKNHIFSVHARKRRGASTPLSTTKTIQQALKRFFFEISFILDFLYKNRIGILDNSESNEMHIKK